MCWNVPSSITPAFQQRKCSLNECPYTIVEFPTAKKYIPATHARQEKCRDIPRGCPVASHSSLSTSVGAREDEVRLGGPLWSPAVAHLNTRFIDAWTNTQSTDDQNGSPTKTPLRLRLMASCLARRIT